MNVIRPMLALLLLPLVVATAHGQYCAPAQAARTYAAPAARSYVYAAPVAAATYAQPYQPQTTYTYSSYYQALAVPAYSVTYAPDNAQHEIARLKTDLSVQRQATEIEKLRNEVLQLRQLQPSPIVQPLPQVPEESPMQPLPPQQPRQQPAPRQQQPMPPAADLAPTSYLHRLQPTAHSMARQACATCHDATTKAKGGGLALFRNGVAWMTAADQEAAVKAVLEGRMPKGNRNLTSQQRMRLVSEIGAAPAVASAK